MRHSMTVVVSVLYSILLYIVVSSRIIIICKPCYGTVERVLIDAHDKIEFAYCI